MVDPERLKHVREGSWVVFWRLVGVAAAVAWTLLLSHLYDARIVGIFATFFTVLSVASLIARFGLDRASIRFIGELLSSPDGSIPDFARRVRASVFLQALVVATVLAAVARPLALLLSPTPDGTIMVLVAAASVIPYSLAITTSEQLRAVNAVTVYAFISFALFPVAAVTLLPLVRLGGPPLPPLFAYFGGTVLAGGMGLLQWRRQTAVLRSRPVTREVPRMRDVLPVARYMVLASSMLLLIDWADILVLSSFRSQAEVGIYSVAARVAMLASLPSLPVVSVLGPRFAQGWGRDDWTSIRASFRGGWMWMTAIGLPVGVVVFVAAPWLLSFFGKEFLAGVVPLRLLLIGHAASMLAGPVGYALDMTGSHRAWQRILWIAGASNIALNFLLIPTFGAGGAATASLVAMVMWNGLGILVLMRSFREHAHEEAVGGGRS